MEFRWSFGADLVNAMNENRNFSSTVLTIDVANQRAWNGNDEITLPPKAFAMLCYLAKHRNQLRSKQELLDQVWPDLYVNEGQVKGYIRDLRKALNDDAEAPQFIETVRGRGYRFIGSVVFGHAPKECPSTPCTDTHLLNSDDQVLATQQNRHLMLWPHILHQYRSFVLVLLSAILCLSTMVVWFNYSRPSIAPEALMAYPLPEKPSLIVLPFVSVGGDSSQDYLADGITRSIITTLAKIPKLSVVARHSTFAYEDKTVTAQQVAEKFGARYVLEGSVQQASDRVRISVQLIDSRTGHHLWAQEYDRKFSNLFELQDDITWQVATELEVKLTQGEMARIWRHQTDDPEAYRYFLQGIERVEHYSKLEMEQGQQLLEKAVTLDPGFVDAWSWLGWTYQQQAKNIWIEDTAKAYAQASVLAYKALSLDEHDADAYALLGAIHWFQGDLNKGLEFTEKAVKLDPDYAENVAVLAGRLIFLDRADEALILARKSLRLNPFYPGWYLRVLGNAHLLREEYDQAIAALQQAVQLKGRCSHSCAELVCAYVEAGRLAEARTIVARMLKFNPDYTVSYYGQVNVMLPVVFKRYRQSLLKAGLPD